MNEQYEVRRLLDGSDPLEAELRHALRVASQDGPSALQLAQMTEGVLGTVAAGAGAGAGAGASSGALKWLALKSTWAKLALVFCTVGSAAWMVGRGLQSEPEPLWGSAPTEQTLTEELIAAPTTTSGLRPGHADLPTADPAPLPAQRATTDALFGAEGDVSTEEVAASRDHGRPVAGARRGVSRRPRRHSRASAVRTTSVRAAVNGSRTSASPQTAPVREPEKDTAAPESPASAESPTNDPTELALLGEAQRALAQQPAAALELLERHRARYSASHYAQERDALILDALSRLGRADDLQRQAASFLARYPRSPHRARVHELLRQAAGSAP